MPEHVQGSAVVRHETLICLDLAKHVRDLSDRGFMVARCARYLDDTCRNDYLTEPLDFRPDLERDIALPFGSRGTGWRGDEQLVVQLRSWFRITARNPDGEVYDLYNRAGAPGTARTVDKWRGQIRSKLHDWCRRRSVRALLRDGGVYLGLGEDVWPIQHCHGRLV